jgi:transcription elongation factor Elf1
MKFECPFCSFPLNVVLVSSSVDDEYSLFCEHCGARGAIFKRKGVQ